MRAVREIIRRLRDEGRCVLFSSHVMQEVTAVSDRIIVIAGGRLVAQGTADELLQQAGRESLEDAFLALVGVEAGSH
jgi:sodium transport system ATP-binding protein